MSKSRSTRERIVSAAAELLTNGGRDAVTTRTVSAAAGVQAPTIYRLFGDMQGLLDAVASFGFAAYLRDKTGLDEHCDTLDRLRRGWDMHIGFGVANPAFYTLIYGNPQPAAPATAAVEAARILRGFVEQLAAEGRLKLGIDLAVDLIHSAGMGVTMTLIGTSEEQRDLSLSIRAREAVLSAVVAGDGAAATAGGPVARAVALKASLDEVDGIFTSAERGLLDDWLDRVAASA